MILNGKQFELDFLDADVLEKIEQAYKSLQGKQIEKDVKISESVRQQCTFIFEFFDEVFGDNIAREIFGNTTSLKVCADVLVEFTNEYEKQKTDYVNVVSKYSKDRIK